MTLLDLPRSSRRKASWTSPRAFDDAAYIAPLSAFTPIATFDALAPTTYRSKEALMEYATRQLGALAVRQRATRADAYVAAAQLINAITPEGASPTPQIGDNGEGGIAAEWLVNGRSLVIDYADPLQIFISAVDADGVRLFDADITFSWHADDDIIARSRDLLAEMAAEINAPISLA